MLAIPLQVQEADSVGEGVPEALDLEYLYTSVVLNMWVSTPWGDMSDIYVMMRNGSKTAAMKDQWNNFTVGSHRSMRSCIKGPQ